MAELYLVQPHCDPIGTPGYMSYCVEDTGTGADIGHWIGHAVNTMLPAVDGIWTCVVVMLYLIIIVVGYVYSSQIMSWALSQKRNGGAGGFILFLIAAAAAVLFYVLGSAIILIGILIIVGWILKAISK